MRASGTTQLAHSATIKQATNRLVHWRWNSRLPKLKERLARAQLLLINQILLLTPPLNPPPPNPPVAPFATLPREASGLVFFWFLFFTRAFRATLLYKK